MMKENLRDGLRKIASEEDIELDVRLVLKPHLGKEIEFTGYVDGVSLTKGKYPKPSTIIKRLSALNEEIDIPYLWILTEEFDPGYEYVFKATVIEYTTYNKDSIAMTKYGIGNVKHLVKHEGDITAATRALDHKVELSDKANNGNSSHAVKIITDIMQRYGIILSPQITEDGTWKAVVGKVMSMENQRTIAVADTFPAAVVEARDLIEFLCEEV